MSWQVKTVSIEQAEITLNTLVAQGFEIRFVVPCREIFVTIIALKKPVLKKEKKS